MVGELSGDAKFDRPAVEAAGGLAEADIAAGDDAGARAAVFREHGEHLIGGGPLGEGSEVETHAGDRRAQAIESQIRDLLAE